MSRRISSLLRLLALLATAHLAWAGPMAAELAGASVTAEGSTPLTREAFLASLSRELATHFNLDGDLTLELLRPWTPPAQVAAVWTVSVSDFPTLMSSALVLRCRILADATPVADSQVVLRANLWRDAWATRSPLTAGAVFEPAMLETRKVDLLRERDALPAAVGDRSYVFARGVAAGHLLTWRDIARRPLVKKGEIVEVSAVDGLLVVTMKGIAMENGGQGETVTVRNPDSRRDFPALVVDENRVQVRF